jgi:hydroxyacylglutathione hydrolase
MLKTFISDFTENTYLITEQKETIIIDPGVKFKELSDYVAENELHVKAILLTHGHVDHIFTLNECVDAFDCPVYIHENERDFLFDPNLNLSSTTISSICPTFIPPLIILDSIKIVPDPTIIKPTYAI